MIQGNDSNDVNILQEQVSRLKSDFSVSKNAKNLLSERLVSISVLD